MSSYSFLLSSAEIEDLQTGNKSIPSALPRNQEGFSDFQYNISMPGYPLSSGGFEEWGTELQQHVQWVWDNGLPLKRLEVSDCIDAYADGVSIDRGDVILVSDEIGQYASSNESWWFGYVLKTPEPNDFHYLNTSNDPEDEDLPHARWEWMCPSDPLTPNCNPQNLIGQNEWKVQNGRIDYCMSRKMPPSCELNMSLWILLVLLLCNVGKLLSICLAVLFCTDPVLLTAGDAMASFLVREDTSTRGLCTAPENFVLMRWHLLSRGERPESFGQPLLEHGARAWKKTAGSLAQVARGMFLVTTSA